jgi:hypothetical protein
VFVDNRYVSKDTWTDAKGRSFQPQIYYFVGGATKLPEHRCGESRVDGDGQRAPGR